MKNDSTTLGWGQRSRSTFFLPSQHWCQNVANLKLVVGFLLIQVLNSWLEVKSNWEAISLSHTCTHVRQAQGKVDTRPGIGPVGDLSCSEKFTDCSSTTLLQCALTTHKNWENIFKRNGFLSHHPGTKPHNELNNDVACDYFMNQETSLRCLKNSPRKLLRCWNNVLYNLQTWLEFPESAIKRKWECSQKVHELQVNKV